MATVIVLLRVGEMKNPTRIYRTFYLFFSEFRRFYEKDDVTFLVKIEESRIPSFLFRLDEIFNLQIARRRLI